MTMYNVRTQRCWFVLQGCHKVCILWKFSLPWYRPSCQVLSRFQWNQKLDKCSPVSIPVRTSRSFLSLLWSKVVKFPKSSCHTVATILQSARCVSLQLQTNSSTVITSRIQSSPIDTAQVRWECCAKCALTSYLGQAEGDSARVVETCENTRMVWHVLAAQTSSNLHLQNKTTARPLRKEVYLHLTATVLLPLDITFHRLNSFLRATYFIGCICTRLDILHQLLGLC